MGFFVGEITAISTVKNGAEQGFCGITGVSPVNSSAASPFYEETKDIAGLFPSNPS
jgi:hypothetical protein